MPIDRTDPADDPNTPRPPHSPQPPGDSRPPDATPPPDTSRAPDVPRPPGATPPPARGPADRETVHRAYRTQVDGIYATHGNSAQDVALADRVSAAWAEAVPSLRHAWEEHEHRYPERERPTPQTHPDRSWSSGDARRLTPDQNTGATKACADIHDEGERVILPAMLRIEAADPHRHLVGLEHMLKGTDRLKEKIADVLQVESHLSPRQALDKVPDAVRYTFTYHPDRYAEGIGADIVRLKADGFEEVKLKNLWSSNQYKGINSQWRRPETGLRFEVQFHTQESLEAKELMHEAYERLRLPETETTQAERDELEEFQHQVNAPLVAPPGTDKIRDFPEKKR